MTEAKPERSSKIDLSTSNLAAVMIAMGATIGLLGYGLSTLGRNLIGGNAGEWTGLILAFAILCAGCWILVRCAAHPSLNIACAIWVCMGGSKVGEIIGDDVGGAFAQAWGSSIGMLIAFIGLFLVSALFNGADAGPAGDEAS